MKLIVKFAGLFIYQEHKNESGESEFYVLAPRTGTLLQSHKVVLVMTSGRGFINGKPVEEWELNSRMLRFGWGPYSSPDLSRFPSVGKLVNSSLRDSVFETPMKDSHLRARFTLVGGKMAGARAGALFTVGGVPDCPIPHELYWEMDAVCDPIPFTRQKFNGDGDETLVVSPAKSGDDVCLTVLHVPPDEVHSKPKVHTPPKKVEHFKHFKDLYDQPGDLSVPVFTGYYQESLPSTWCGRSIEERGVDPATCVGGGG